VAVNCRFTALAGNPTISLQAGCNGMSLQGTMLIPSGSRGIDVTAVCFANKAAGTVDFVYPYAATVGSLVRFNAAAYDNVFDLQYIDSSLLGVLCADGAHVVFAAGAYNNLVNIPNAVGRGFRVFNSQAALNNYVNVPTNPSEQYQSGDFLWDYLFPDKVHANTATSIYLPPTWLRRNRLEFQGNSVGVKAFASYYANSVSINAAGSGGTNGTYYQDITNTNTQQGHGCTVQVLIAGGVMSSVTLLYPGWQKTSALPTTTPITVGGLSGGVINIGSFTEYPVGNGGKQFATSCNIADFVLNTFSNEAAGDVGWVCFPQFPPLNVFSVGNTGSAPVPDLKLGA
jgi:hypothetical protein